jgi:hypothetical protein
MKARRRVAAPSRAKLAPFVTTAAQRYPIVIILHLEATIDRIPHVSRLPAPHHRTGHTGYRAAYSPGVGHPLSVGPQLEPRSLKRTRKTHLAVAPYRQRNGASIEFDISRRPAGHGRASRSRLSPAGSRPANCGLPQRCTSRCCRFSHRRRPACRAKAPSSTAYVSTARRPAGSSSRSGTPRPLDRSSPRRSQLHVRHINHVRAGGIASAPQTVVFDFVFILVPHLFAIGF